ncbi:DUF3105 domain-containing protein [Micromonospora aurantiaca (nom. illeg.)]|uniref:DUF3105 domain-containing protein n=1 Tax=Micromonospora aurantiaca (nom. illeg.) TaxID=47850 RepID=UPI003DA1CFC5
MSRKSPTRVRRTPVTVRSARPWGVIATVTAVSLVAAGIIGYAALSTWQGSRPWSDRLTALSGVTSYTSAGWLTREHKAGPLTYEVTPSVGGNHNSAWQNCTGDVYDAPIADEHATHSLEHGAVWVTYRPDLPADQIQRLADRVRALDYLMISPADGLDAPISVQAWGYRLTVASAADERVDEFIRIARVNAGPERGATCSGGITATGTAPRDGAGM